MKIKSLTVKLAALLCACGLAFSAQAANVAQIGETKYETLQEALDAAQAGDTVKLLANVPDAVVINSAGKITIDGQGQYGIVPTSSTHTALKITASDAEVELKNITIGDTTYTQRAVNIYNAANVKLAVTNSRLLGTVYTLNVYNEGGGSVDNVDITVTDSEIEGRAALNLWGNGGKVTVTGGKLTGNNRMGYSPGNNEFGVIVLEGLTTRPDGATNYEVSITGTEIKATSLANNQGNRNEQSMVLFNPHTDGNTVTLTNCTVERGEGEATKYPLILEDKCSGSRLFVKDVTDKGTSTETAIPAGYAYVAANDGYREVVHAVTAVNGTGYASVQDAIDAAEAGDTVTLLANVDLGADAIVIEEDKNLTLDIGAFNITGAVNGKLVQNYGTLVINGTTGCIYNTEISEQGHDAVCNWGTITVNGGWLGDINNDKTDGNNVNRGAGLRNLGTGVATINGGHFTAGDNFLNSGWAYAIINGDGTDTPTITINNADVYGKNNGNIANNSGAVTVNGGTFDISGTKSYYSLYSSKGDTIVNGGTFTKSGNTRVQIYVSTGSASVAGGAFTKPVPEQYCATGCIPSSTPDPETGLYTVKAGQYVAQIVGGAKFESLQEAINAAADGDTVELLTDCAVSGQISVEKSITIDGNGYTVTSGDDWTGNYVFYVMEEATATAPISCTIKDINIVSTTHQVVFLLNENENVGNVLNLKNVDVVCDGECVYSNGRATINAEDCKFLHEGVYATGKDNVYYSALVVGYSGVINATNCVVTSFGNGASTFPSGGKITLVGTDITVSAVEGIANSGYALWARNEDYTNYPQYLSDSVIEVESGNICGGIKITDKYTSGDKDLYAPIIKISGGCFSQYIADDTGYIVEGKTCTTKMMSNGLYRVVDATTVTFAAGEDAPAGATVPAAIKYPSGDAAELALGVPNYSSENITFGGWKMSDNTVVAALPAGTTGNQTLTATWKAAQKITVDTATETVEVKVTEEWVEANVTPAGEEATPEEIKEALEGEQHNGLTGLQNYVLGLDGSDPTAKVKVDSEPGPSEKEVPVVNTLKTNDQTVDTGFKVQYSLDKVDVDGETVAEGTKQDTSDLSLDLTKVVETENCVSYYKMTATITKEGAAGTVSKVSSENTIGVLAVTNAPATTIIGVPWESLESGEIKVSELVRTENLSVGDQITVYGDDGKYKAWRLDEDKEWEQMPTSTTSGTQNPGEATGIRISRGKGVWLTRKNPEEPIYLMGQTAAAAAEPTPVEVPEEAGKEAWTLVASPKVEPVNVADVASQGDIIRMPTAGAPKDFKYKNGSWGYTEYYVDAKGITRSRRVESATIPAGRGFWYINKSTDPDKKINWDTDND